MKAKVVAQSLWVAVKVERGFVAEAKLFHSFAAAQRLQRRWQATLNPDYDEAAVVSATLPKPSTSC
jgi:hypothetical protein